MTDEYAARQQRDSFIRDLGLRAFDWALPQDFFDDCLRRFNENPQGVVVWSYDDGSLFGVPVAVHARGSKFVASFYRRRDQRRAS